MGALAKRTPWMLIPLAGLTNGSFVDWTIVVKVDSGFNPNRQVSNTAAIRLNRTLDPVSGNNSATTETDVTVTDGNTNNNGVVVRHIDIDDEEIYIRLTNNGPDRVITKIEVRAPDRYDELEKVRLDGETIFKGERSPTTTIYSFRRTPRLKAGASGVLRFEFDEDVRRGESEVTVTFDDGFVLVIII